MNKLLTTYLKYLGIDKLPKNFEKYLKSPTLLRLKNVGYLCGMDYASKDIYDFKEKITRYDHSLTSLLMTWKLKQDITESLAALYHDAATPCFSHVIDYMNKDYEKQESTEEYLNKIIYNDEYLINCFKKDNINVDDIINFKKYKIVDNNRPKSCVDRIDGVILTGISWTKNIEENDIKSIVSDIKLFINEDNEEEIGFSNEEVVKKVIEVNNSIDLACHSYTDNYMMELLAKITRISIEKKYIKYDDLYYLNEKELFKILNSIHNLELSILLYIFKNVKKKDIPHFELSNVKIRKLSPLLNGKRYNH